MSSSRWWLKVPAWLGEKLVGWLVADGSRCSYVTVIICIDMSLGCDDNRKGLCQAGGGRVRGRGWSAGWGGAHKGARRPFTKCSSPRRRRLWWYFGSGPAKLRSPNGLQRVRGSLQDI